MKTVRILHALTSRWRATVALAALALILPLVQQAAAMAGENPPVDPSTPEPAFPEEEPGEGSGAGPPIVQVDAAFDTRSGLPAIYTMDRDGSNAELLVRVPDARWNGSPAWSRDGSRIAFDATAAGFEAGRIYIATLAGPARSKLQDLGLGTNPRWSPDNTKIAFSVMADNPDGLQPGVWIMRTDGTDRRWLANGERPRWSPDGAKIACVSMDPQSLGVNVVDAVTGKATLVAELVSNSIPGPTWSPDGKSLAYCAIYSTLPERGKLIIVDVEKPHTQRVRFRGNVGWVPSWSPDGKSILFWIADNQSPFAKFHVIDAKGDAPPVTLKDQTAVRQNSDGVWSPDGKKIAFSNDR